MTKIGDKGAQRRALRERGASAPRSGSLSVPTLKSGPGNSEAGAAPSDEVTRALAYYRKHRERQARWRKRKKEGK